MKRAEKFACTFEFVNGSLTYNNKKRERLIKAKIRPLSLHVELGSVLLLSDLITGRYGIKIAYDISFNEKQ